MALLSSGEHFAKSIGPSRVGNSHANFLKWAKIKLLRDVMPVLIICKCDKDCLKNEGAIIWTMFSICLWDLLVAVETKVLTSFAPKLFNQTPPPWWYLWNLIKNGQLFLEIYLSKSVDGHRALLYTISLPCEPCSGELKNVFNSLCHKVEFCLNGVQCYLTLILHVMYIYTFSG